MFKSKEGTSIQKIIEQDGLYIEQLRDEVIRLNNIINELEKVIHYELLEIRKNNDYNIGLKNVSHILKRLEEWKEGK